MAPQHPDLMRLSDPRLCLGCGACAYIGGAEHVTMQDREELGLRPLFGDTLNAAQRHEMVAVCPTMATDFGALKRMPDYTPTVDRKTERDWGAITGIWEGFAANEELRFKGSSGGALTALALYCLESRGFHGVLHTGESPQDPIRNTTRLSRSRDDLMATLGSRYAPAAICEGLGQVEAAPGPCVVIGKPVEIAGTRNAMALRPALAEKVGVTLSFFCAETPPTGATRALLDHFGVAQNTLEALRYRGHGWPGYFTTRTAGEAPRQHWIYYDSWAFLQKYRPWAALMWPDGSGELADISCGDPWYEEPDNENPGFSLIVARTQLGREIVEGAIAAGYLSATQAETWKLENSQKGLLEKKGSIWGRRLAHRLVGIPNTAFPNLDLFGPWLGLSLKAKRNSLLGTLRRIVRKGLWKRVP